MAYPGIVGGCPPDLREVASVEMALRCPSLVPMDDGEVVALAYSATRRKASGSRSATPDGDVGYTIAPARIW